jgi:hypothetical protein
LINESLRIATSGTANCSLCKIEEEFRTLKSDLAIQPNIHQELERIEA